MKKVAIVLSDFTQCASPSPDVDYWVMQGVLSDKEIDEHRLSGLALTVFDRIAEDDELLATIAMATLHNSDWRELRLFR